MNKKLPTTNSIMCTTAKKQQQCNVLTYLYLYVDGLEGVSLKCPHRHQNVVSIVETSACASNIYPVGYIESAEQSRTAEHF